MKNEQVMILAPQNNFDPLHSVTDRVSVDTIKRPTLAFSTAHHCLILLDSWFGFLSSVDFCVGFRQALHYNIVLLRGACGTYRMTMGGGDLFG